MIGVTHSGSFKNTERWLRRMIKGQQFPSLDTFGQRGVDALSNATPKDTRETSRRWRYSIVQDHSGITIAWHNDHVEDGKPIAILLQYGHATGTGGYVQGRDYINPAMQPVFDQIAYEVWKRVMQ